MFTTDGCEPLAADYDADRVVQSAWKSLPNTELELHWEKDFWSRFLDPNVFSFGHDDERYQASHACA